MVLTDDFEWAERMRAIRSQGFVGDSRNYIHNIVGYNYRLTNMQAGIGLAQCEMIDQKVAKKREIAKKYTERLAGEKGLILQSEEKWANSTFWNFTVIIQDSVVNRDDVAQKMFEGGIQTRLTFKALHMQPVFSSTADPRFPDIQGSYPVSEKLSQNGLCLPSGLNLTQFDIDRIVSELFKAMKG